jgi:hypothetical protein
MIVTLAVAVGGLAAGCKDEAKSPCKKYCQTSIAEYQDFLDDHYDCQMDNESKYVKECVESCEEAMEDISSSEREEAEACIACVCDEVGSSPKYGDINEAIEDECEDECVDDEGMSEFLDEFDGIEVDEDDLADCDGGVYDNVAACQYLEDHINGLSCWTGDDIDMGCEAYADVTTCDYADYFYCLADCYYCDDGYPQADSECFNICYDLAEC